MLPEGATRAPIIASLTDGKETEEAKPIAGQALAVGDDPRGQALLEVAMEGAKTVKVYSTPTCPHCKRVKQFLEEKGISYQEIDVASDMNARQEMVNKSGRLAVPVIEIDGNVVVGFDETSLRKHLDL